MSDYIPQELLTNILQRLSNVNDLLTCRNVSKQWLTIIDSPEFITNHLQLSLTNSNPGVMLLQREKDPILYMKPEHHFSPRQYKPHQFLLMGSCHGLLCISQLLDNNNNIITVLNPSTGDFQHMSTAASAVKSEENEPHLSPLAYGFGYDAVTKDYQVVRIMRPRTAAVCRVEVYGVRAKSFSYHENLFQIVPKSDNRQMGVFVGGALHWSTNYFYPDILALDLGTETFRKIPQPDYDRNSWVLMSIGVIRSCLCISAVDKRNKLADIWVMDEYGDIQSWRLVFRIKDCIPTSVVPIEMNRGRILLKMDGFKFVWCGPEENKMELQEMMVDESGFYEAVYWLESLVKVSVNDYDGGDEKQVMERKERHLEKLFEQEKSWNSRPAFVNPFHHFNIPLLNHFYDYNFFEAMLED